MNEMKLTPKRIEINTIMNFDSPFDVLRYYPYRHEILELSHLDFSSHDKKVCVEGRIISDIKTDYLHSKNPRLHADETLIALATGSKDDENCLKAMQALKNLKDTEMHSSAVLSEVDIKIIRKLGIRLTMDPMYSSSHKLYNK